MRLGFPLFVAIVSLVALGASLASAATTYTYDELGRVTSVTYDNGNQIIYTYDSAGNRTARSVATAVPNPAPTTVNDSRTMAHGATTITFDPRVNDPNPSSLSITAVSPGRFGVATINVQGGVGVSVTYTTAVASDVDDEVVYTVKGPTPPGLTASGVITYHINNGP